MNRFGAALVSAFVTLLVSASSAAAAPAAIGDWTGRLYLPQGTLRLIFHIGEPAPGILQATLDSPDQRALGMPVSSVVIDGQKVRLEVKAVAGVLEGALSTDGDTIVGQWVQGGQGVAIVLVRNGSQTAANPLKFSDHVVQSDAAIREILKARVDTGKAVGLVVGVIDGARRSIVSYGAFDAADPRPVAADTVMEIGSVTKVFTSLLLADAVERGEVALSDPLARFLPVKVPERNGRAITLLDLATHTSGLPSLPGNLTPKDMTNPYVDYTDEQLFAFLPTYELKRDIGGGWEYSNMAVGLLGQALARRAGMPFEELVKARITGPLKMTDTSIVLSADQKARLAPGHDPALKAVANWDLPTFAGAGALRSTMSDMMTFLAAELSEPTTPLQQAMRAQRLPRRPTGLPGAEQALGWMMRKSDDGKEEVLWHNGATGGYRAFIAFNAATGKGVVVLSNTATPSGVNDIGFNLLIGAPLLP